MSENQKDNIKRLKTEMNRIDTELQNGISETEEFSDLIWINNSHKIFIFNELNTVEMMVLVTVKMMILVIVKVKLIPL
jgi:hypothetical protein